MAREVERIVHVPMGAIGTAKPPGMLEIRGLGSCIALAMYDPGSGVAGLAHTVIPRPLKRPLPGPAWASTEAVRNLVEEMRANGARPSRIVARIAGGASMFASTMKGFNVGEENTRAIVGALEEVGVPLISIDVGGTESRSVSLDPATGDFVSLPRATAHDRVEVRASKRRPMDVDRDRELASVLLYHAVAPLSTLLDRPVVVEEPSAHELTPAELGDFFGGVATRLLWSFSSIGEDVSLGVVVPEAHAVRLARAVQGDASDPVSEDEVLRELVSLIVGHAATALARHLRARILPAAPQSRRGTVHQALRNARRAFGEAEPVLTFHGRAHVEGVLRGADFALLLSSGWRLWDRRGGR